MLDVVLCGIEFLEFYLTFKRPEKSIWGYLIWDCFFIGFVRSAYDAPSKYTATYVMIMIILRKIYTLLTTDTDVDAFVPNSELIGCVILLSQGLLIFLS